MDIVAQGVSIHPFPILVDTKTQAPAYLLALADIAAALLQGADLEYIGIVPALPQSRMGEDKPHRRPLGVAVQQQFLVFHNKVVSVFII